MDQQTYLLEINEEQRVALIVLLQTLPTAVQNSDSHPLAYVLGGLEDVPNVEKSAPGIIHSLCS
jgi:hypothetical protein